MARRRKYRRRLKPPAVNLSYDSVFFTFLLGADCRACADARYRKQSKPQRDVAVVAGLRNDERGHGDGLCLAAFAAGQNLFAVFKSGGLFCDLALVPGVFMGSDNGDILDCIAVCAVDGFAARFGAGFRLVNGEIGVPCVTLGRDNGLILDRVAVCAVDGLAAVFDAACRLVNGEFVVPSVTVCGDSLGNGVAADGAEAAVWSD